MHALVLKWFGFTWKMAIADSAISNILLVCVSLLISLTLQFYIPQKNKYSYLAGICLALAVIWLLISRSLLFFVFKETVEFERFFSQSVPVRFAIGFLITGCMALVCVLWYTLQEQQEINKRKGEADRLSKEAELFKLRQQLQPHFLFNSLNSINALIGFQPDKARTMIQQLSDFLRGTLKKEDSQWISIKEELEHLQLYLDIEKLRFGHRLTAVVHNETNKEMRLPAMLLQPVVENSIKFGLYDTTDGIHIHIEAKEQEDLLVLQVKNPFDPATSAPKKGTGFGLRSVQRRLYLLYARTDLLQTETIGNLFITTIKIPQLNEKGVDH
jgi:hypothetical protein